MGTVHRPGPIARMVAVVVVAASACSGGGGGGDVEAFCELLQTGVGIGSDRAEVDPEDFAALEEVAPEDIAPAVRELANTARSLEEIPDEELAELFAAAFDPDADEARNELLAYAAQHCDVDISGISDGRVTTDEELGADLSDYVKARFQSESWTEVVSYRFIRVDAALDGIDIRFEREPRDEEDLAACNAIGVFLYDLRGGTGAVTVRDEDGVLLAEQASPDEPCART